MNIDFSRGVESKPYQQDTWHFVKYLLPIEDTQTYVERNKHCMGCGHVFIARHNNAKWCPICKEALRQADDKMRTEMRSEARRIAREAKLAQAGAIACAVCGEIVVPLPSQKGKQKYCSGNCKQKADQAAQKIRRRERSRARR